MLKKVESFPAIGGSSAVGTSRPDSHERLLLGVSIGELFFYPLLKIARIVGATVKVT
jgi:hypothetical protein